MTIRAWLQQRRARSAARHYERGAAWARSEMESGRPRSDIRALVENGIFFDGDNPFDRGAQDALDSGVKPEN
jgi:hypothetical protein